MNEVLFFGKLGFVLSAAGASVGLGKYMAISLTLRQSTAVEYFLLIYIILALSFWLLYDCRRETALSGNDKKTGRGVGLGGGGKWWRSSVGWMKSLHRPPSDRSPLFPYWGVGFSRYNKLK